MQFTEETQVATENMMIFLLRLIFYVSAAAKCVVHFQFLWVLLFFVVLFFEIIAVEIGFRIDVRKAFLV